MYTLDKEKLDILEKAILEAGKYAVEMQSHVHRGKKADGSILTEVDLAISHKILAVISKLFPECAIVSEEEVTEEKKDAPYTFVLDPIDGTDVYSQGLPSFAIALGILDGERTPVGAIITAPRFGIAKEGLLIRLDPGKELLVDGERFEYKKNGKAPLQVLMGSKSFAVFDFSNFKGKVRTFGSSIIHLILPAILPEMSGAVIEPCFVWDITSAHAVLKSVGADIVYANGEDFEYTDEFIWKKKSFKMPIYAGDSAFISSISKQLPLL